MPYQGPSGPVTLKRTYNLLGILTTKKQQKDSGDRRENNFYLEHPEQHNQNGYKKGCGKIRYCFEAPTHDSENQHSKATVGSRVIRI